MQVEAEVKDHEASIFIEVKAVLTEHSHHCHYDLSNDTNLNHIRRGSNISSSKS